MYLVLVLGVLEREGGVIVPGMSDSTVLVVLQRADGGGGSLLPSGVSLESSAPKSIRSLVGLLASR